MIKMAQNNIVQQILFWAISFFVLFRIFTINYSNGLADVIFTILFLLPLVFAVYANYNAIHFFLDKKRYSLYALSFIAILIISVGLHYLVIDIISDWVFPGFYFASYYSILENIQFVLSFLIVSLLLKLSKNWFKLQKRQRVLEKENHAVKLGMLKAQINPHFLFNSLNNIYATTSPENKQARKYLLKLSDALRYMIYETDVEFVELQNEVNYLRNYIDLERLRMEQKEDIGFEVHGVSRQHIIAPLLLLPIIENCFKHCDKDDPHIRIDLKVENHQLRLTTENKQGGVTMDKPGGVGFVNVRKRLELLYPKRHTLEAKIDGDIFRVRLTVKLNDHDA